MSYQRSGYPSHGTDGRNPYRLTLERVARIMREIEDAEQAELTAQADAERAKSAELLEALRAVIETRAAYDGESSWSLESRWAVYVIARDAAVALLERLK